MKKPDVSVVISSYNKRETIGQSIRSVLLQEGVLFELIVVDDGSTDGSSNILDAFLRDERVKIIRKGHSGISATKNIGTANARSDIVYFVDGDCVLDQNSLAMLLSSFTIPRIGCVGGAVRAVNKSNSMANAIELMQNEVERKWPFGANVAYRKEVLNRTGGFDESAEGGEDVDLFLRTTKMGFGFVYNPAIVVRTVNPESFSSFLNQRYRWGKGFVQLAGRHKEVLTARIRLCFALTLLTLFSPVLALLDIRMILLFPSFLALCVGRFLPSAFRIARRASDRRGIILLPVLRFLNGVAYLASWFRWKVFGLFEKGTLKRSILEEARSLSN